MTIAPHGGGSLVDLRVSGPELETLKERAQGLPRLVLDARELTDLELLAIGGFTPLTGFMTQEQCRNVVDEMHLPGGIPWSIPVTLSTMTERRK